MAFLVSWGAALLSDLAMGLLSGDLSRALHGLIPVVYASLALIVCLGFWLCRRRKATPIAGAILAGVVLLFGGPALAKEGSRRRANRFSPPREPVLAASR